MQRTAIILLAAAMPAMAQTPPASPGKQPAPAEAAPRHYPPGSLLIPLRTAGPACYYIRQINQNLQAPRDTPEFVPLASAGNTPLGQARTDCLPGPVILKAAEK